MLKRLYNVLTKNMWLKIIDKEANRYQKQPSDKQLKLVLLLVDTYNLLYRDDKIQLNIK